MKYFLTIFIFLILCITLPLSAATLGIDSTETTVTLQLKWKHQFQFAGYYAAIEQGFYKEKGLHVELLEAKEGEEPGESVLNGKADFGVATSDIVLMRAAGKPVVVMASIFQHSPLVLVASKSSGIEHVQNLVGKKLMIEAHAADLIAFMHDEGVSLNECTLYTHTFDVHKLLDHSVDAITAYMTDEPFLLQQDSFDYSIISPLAGGIDFYGDVLFTSEDFIRRHPDVVEKFLKATIDGWNYAMHHQEEMIEVILTKYSKRHSKEHLEYEADKMNLYIMPDVVEIGYMNRGRWENIINTYYRVGMLEEPISTKGLIYDDYRPKEPHIPWALIGIFAGIVAVISSVTFFFYRLSKKLKHEIKRRGVVQDELTRSEKQLKILNETKDKFFSIIAHDLISPFNSIEGFSSLLAEEGSTLPPEEVSMMAGRVLSQARTTRFLLENLLAWSTSESGRMPFKPEKISLNELLQTTLLPYQTMASQKKVSIQSIIESLPEIVADRQMLTSIIGNLVVNAIKFCHTGGLITITATTKDKWYEIVVTDDGIGMTEAEMARLFQLKTSGLSSGTANEKGTGLGLVLCKEFAEHHGGSINVESKPGEGSRFIVSLPSTLQGT